MALNETTITYGDNSIPTLYQYDYGQVIIFDGFELPETFEVHFATGTGAESKTAIGQADTVAIPDEFLMTSGKLRGWIFLHESEEDGETEYDFIINVLHRAAPTDTMPTPVEHAAITELIEQMNTAVTEAEQSAEEAKEAAESIPADIVRYDTEQTLTREQQYTAQNNINAADYDSVWEGINSNVSYYLQTGKSDLEKSQARTNIGAANVAYEIRNLKDGSANQSIRQVSSTQESASYTIGEYASAFGRNTKSSGQASHAEGTLTVASGASSHTEGAESTASGQASHAEGSATASGNTAHAENNQTTASGNSSHSEGMYTIASGGVSHSEGLSTTASGVGSHTHGEGTVANHRAQTAIGQYNIADPSTEVVGRRGNYVEIVGNGTADNARSNARTLDWDGNEVLSGKLTVGANAENANDVPSLAQVQGMIPTVPTDVSAFNNDAGYQTASDVNTALIASLITDTASGDPCAFPDGASAPVVDCKVAIVPKQEGSGTPSPSNIRPISGWTEMTMRRTGLNLWDEEWELGSFNQSTGEPYADTTHIRSKNYTPVVGGKTYYVANARITWYEYGDNYAYLRVGNSGAYVGANATFVPSSDAKYIKFNTTTAYGTTYKNDICINVSGSKNGTYEPYKGTQTYTQSWDTTVYGGTLDLTTGVLTVTDGYIASYNGETLPSTWISDRDVYAVGTTPTTGAEVVYKLAEPTTIQLTPTEVQTILGSNTFSADTGAVTVEYRCDTKLYIAKVIA